MINSQNMKICVLILFASLLTQRNKNKSLKSFLEETRGNNQSTCKSIFIVYIIPLKFYEAKFKTITKIVVILSPRRMRHVGPGNIPRYVRLWMVNQSYVRLAIWTVNLTSNSPFFEFKTSGDSNGWPPVNIKDKLLNLLT